ncbi:hypothetical protein CVT26_009183 [Gymnopilus dilepis]|uniref:CxC2-like cysteine cluster KDZ transposase-associated domain-containing protein n=1 Tax=Gymnopilus dilepis TaxID=231916 RepID=A0A409Y9F6_9AGAR|nr:hypothetical protein CVT26_009183 [Gymnopilus dilepis]
MSSSRPKKRVRVNQEGGVSQNLISLHDDDYSAIHYREGRLINYGTSIGVAPPARTLHASARTWESVLAWGPEDDQNFALDPDGQWYDEAVEKDVMDEGTQQAKDLPESKKKKKRKRSRVSKRPHIVWKELHRSSYLDEISRLSGRADFRTASKCPDCVSRNVSLAGPPVYRCEECYLPDLVCESCCIRRHKLHPLHLIEKWTDTGFVRVSLKSIGLRVQLNHASLHCSNPIPCHASMLVLHTNGIHDVAFDYCGCDRALPQHIQLVRRRFYPASQLIPKTCASFTLLELLHKLALTTKASTYDFYRALENLTDNSGLRAPRSRYKSLFRIIMQWRHIKLLKWGGRAHDPAGVGATEVGQLALRCPSCPYPGINLPDDWEEAPAHLRFLYMMFICMDANFRLKNQLVSSYSQDPGLGTGWAYMVEREPYEKYVLSQVNDEEISSCVGFQALAQANTKFSQGLRYTGVGGVFCGRSEMVLPQGVGNLQKGERYSNMDYVFAAAIRNYTTYVFTYALSRLALLLVIVSYDVACQWFKNLFVRAKRHWPEELRLPLTTKFIPAIPKLHEPMHQQSGHQVFSLNFLPGVGLSDLECPERVWSAHNALGNSTKTQGPGSRHDVLDDHFGFWNWQKYIGMGRTLARKYKTAVADRNIQNEAHRGLNSGLSESLTNEWEEICVKWEQDEFPKHQKNPYQADGVSITEARAKKELAEEEEKRLAGGGIALHATSASSLISMGLEIEETQRRIQRLVKNEHATTTTRKEGTITEQRNQLTGRIRTWEQVAGIYMPGLLQYQAKVRQEGQTTNANANADSTASVPKHPEDAKLWLPSQLPVAVRSLICVNNLPEIEEKLRTAQCYDALDSLRHILKIKTRLIKFKNKNIRGQREGTRSRAIIDRVHERARGAAAKYRAARSAKYLLSGPGNWENDLKVLADSDIRGYQDPDHLRARQARPGTLEDGQLDSQKAGEHPATAETDAFTLFTQERSRRDGTGETRRTLSWIWILGDKADDPENASDDILRVEWARSRARAARTKEEVSLVREEMRRTLEFLEWKAKWWASQAQRRVVDKVLAEGLQAYAHRQARIQRDLATRFRRLWKNPLADSTTTSAKEDDSDKPTPHDIPLPEKQDDMDTSFATADANRDIDDEDMTGYASRGVDDEDISGDADAGTDEEEETDSEGEGSATYDSDDDDD